MQIFEFGPRLPIFNNRVYCNTNNVFIYRESDLAVAPLAQTKPEQRSELDGNWKSFFKG